MQGDHDELEIFLEIRLIPFRNRSKVEERLRNTWVFKEENWPENSGRLIRSWARIDAFVDAVFKHHGSGLHSAASWPQSRADLALIPLQLGATIALDRGHD